MESTGKGGRELDGNVAVVSGSAQESAVSRPGEKISQHACAPFRLADSIHKHICTVCLIRSHLNLTVSRERRFETSPVTV